MFQPNDILDGRYQILREIGQGGTGVVFLAYHLRLKKYVVVKRIKDSVSWNMSARKEVDVLKNLHHPNLPQVYDFVEDGNSIYSVIDFVDGYDLSAYIQAGDRFPEQQLRFWFRQLTEVLVYLHGQNPAIIHCDIKPGNIMITPEGNAVLIDFNISLEGPQGNLTGFSAPYASPEQIELARQVSYGWQPEFSLDGRADIYSLAATFYHLISGIEPVPNGRSAPLVGQDLPYSETFLMLVDRAMSWDREQRPASAVKLLSQVDKLRRKESGYRAYFICRCVSLALSACLIGGGIYAAIRGHTQEYYENYIRSYTSVFSMIASGNGAAAEDLCFQLLNESGYQQFLEDKPEERGRILRALGDIAYASESYSESAQYYEMALIYLSEGPHDVYSSCFRDAIIAYTEAGNQSAADRLLAGAQLEGVEGNDLLLINVILESRNGNQDACHDAAEDLLKNCRDAEMCARACIAAAKVSGSVETEIRWLERGAAYSTSRNILRGLGASYAALAQDMPSAQQRQNTLTKALDYYLQLAEYPYASRNDSLNLATVQRMLGRPHEAVTVLERVLKDFPGDYRVLMNLAFACDDCGDYGKASTYCTQALDAWRKDLSADKDLENSTNIQNLKALAEKLGL